MVYLLKFDQPIGTGKKYVQYYLGWCEDANFEKRIERHRKGLPGEKGGARLTQVAKQRGIGFTVLHTWPGLTHADERRMKNWKNHKKVLEYALKRNT